MLAVAFTLVLALYVLGPDLVSRLILGFSVPRRNVVLTKSEELSRAVLWSIGPLILAFLWAWAWGTLDHLWVWKDLKTCFAGVYSEQVFREHQDDWFRSTRLVLWLNFVLLWRLYFVVAVIGLSFNYVIRNYAKIRLRLKNHPHKRTWLAALVLPRINSWHVLLSRVLLEQDDLHIHVDVLTKAGILYQGRLADKMLEPDGTLIAVMLDSPRRYRREQYLDDLKADKQPKADEYWRDIPTNMFVIMASDIHTINLRYGPENMAALKRRDYSASLQQSLAGIAQAMKVIAESAKTDIK